MARGTSDSERAHDTDEARPESGPEAPRISTAAPSIHRVLSVAAEEYLKWSLQREQDEQARIENLLRESAQVMLDEVLNAVQTKKPPAPALDSATVAKIVREELAVALRDIDRGLTSDAVENLVSQKVDSELRTALHEQQHTYESQLRNQDEAAKARHESTEALLQQSLEQAITRVKEQTSRTATIQATEVATQIARELTENLRDTMSEAFANTAPTDSTTRAGQHEPPPFDTTIQVLRTVEHETEPTAPPPPPEPTTLGDALDTGTFRQQAGRHPLGFLKSDDPLAASAPGGSSAPDPADTGLAAENEVEDAASQPDADRASDASRVKITPEEATPFTIEYASKIEAEPSRESLIDNKPPAKTEVVQKEKETNQKSSFPAAPRPTSDREVQPAERHLDAAFAQDGSGVRESLFAEVAPVGRDDVPMSGPLLNFFSGHSDSGADHDLDAKSDTKPAKKRGFFRRNKGSEDDFVPESLPADAPVHTPNLPPPPPAMEASTKDWTSTPISSSKPEAAKAEEEPVAGSEFEALWNSTDDSIEEVLMDEYGETYDPDEAGDDTRETTRSRLSEIASHGDEALGGPSLRLADFTSAEDAAGDAAGNTAGDAAGNTAGDAAGNTADKDKMQEDRPERRQKSKKRKEKTEKSITDGLPWVKPVDGECPPGYPIKAIYATGRYHVPEGRGYDRVRPDCCYADAEAAEADGFKHSFW